MSEVENESSAVYGDDGHGSDNGSSAAAVDGGDAPAGDGGAGGASRRRRRRRKHRGGAADPQGEAQAGAPKRAQGELALSEGPAPERAEAQPEASTEQGSAPAPAPVHGGQQNQGQFPGSGKRKKRKRKGGGGENPQAPSGPGQHPGGQRTRQHGGWKRREEGPDGNREGARGGWGSEHFGDNAGNSNGARRRGKFGGGRGGFVGPMDHSYRMANGNVADRPSQGGQRMVNGNLRRFDDVEFEPIAVIREDAPARIVCFIEDLFLVTKMQETARKMGVKVQFAKADKETLTALGDAAEADRPSLIVFDLNNAAAKPLATIPKLKGKLKRATSIIGFLQHIQGDLKLKAIEAGCDSVMPKAAFSQNLPNLLRRHGSPQEEELAEA